MSKNYLLQQKKWSNSLRIPLLMALIKSTFVEMQKDYVNEIPVRLIKIREERICRQRKT